MLDRVRIWTNEKKSIHYELKNSDGVPILHEAIPLREWKELRSAVSKTLPKDIGRAQLIDLLTVLCLAAELDEVTESEDG